MFIDSLQARSSLLCHTNEVFFSRLLYKIDDVYTDRQQAIVVRRQSIACHVEHNRLEQKHNAQLSQRDPAREAKGEQGQGKGGWKGREGKRGR